MRLLLTAFPAASSPSAVYCRYNLAGVKEEGVMFLFTDSQITNERFLVSMNDLLASGNIPDLYTVEEMDGIVNAMVPKVKALGKAPDRPVCWDYFLNQVRDCAPCMHDGHVPHRCIVLPALCTFQPRSFTSFLFFVCPSPSAAQVRRNLHVVLCFSPVGDDFRTRAKKFPALVNCTVIDWFQPWPKEALHSVGVKFLKEVDLGR